MSVGSVETRGSSCSPTFEVVERQFERELGERYDKAVHSQFVHDHPSLKGRAQRLKDVLLTPVSWAFVSITFVAHCALSLLDFSFENTLGRLRLSKKKIRVETNNELRALLNKKGLLNSDQHFRVNAGGEGRRLGSLLEQEAQALLKILPLLDKSQPTNNQYFELMKGAHIRVYDDSKLFNELKSLKSVSRISSHSSSERGLCGLFSYAQAIRGKRIKELLFSHHTDEEGKNYSWLQLEKSPATWRIEYVIKHLKDYVLYKMHKENIGPYGHSLHNDKNPIIIR